MGVKTHGIGRADRQCWNWLQVSRTLKILMVQTDFRRIRRIASSGRKVSNAITKGQQNTGGKSCLFAVCLMWIIIFAFAARVAVRWYSGEQQFWEGGYGFFFTLAQSIATGNGVSFGGTPTAFRVPLYPMFLAVVTLGHKAFLPVLLAQSLVGAGTVLCAALI